MAKERFSIKHIPSLIKETYLEWWDDQPFDLAATVAYYSIFSLPALLLIVISVAGAVFGQEAVQGKVTEEIAKLTGVDTAAEIQTMIVNAYKKESSTISAIIGLITLLFGATGVFAALQTSLNNVWEVKPDPEKSGIKKLLLDRATSFGIILVIGFLLLISFVLTTFVGILAEWIKGRLPEALVNVFIIINTLVSFAVVLLVFAMLFKYLPDAKIRWKSVWIGAVVTALLFMLGKLALGLYFVKANPASTYGAAGSIILILLWVYYSSLILFFGAEFTQVYARKYIQNIIPSDHAIRNLDYHEDKSKGIKPNE